ncbi:alpha/beta fold hydrolase [Bacillus sp. SCS-153A]|uniref:alpha/beta fold hydrolase n=1 Tax=Rossellomorea sedimentorum TaxID=3115294 RepID=UPI003906A05C
MKNKQINIEGQTVSYYEYGEKEKPALVLLHGMAGSAIYSFYELAELLADEFRLILIDQPGHGKTTAFLKEEDYLFSNLAVWYDKVLKNLLNSPFYLVGHSWGADSALHYTKTFGKKVKGLILLDGAVTFPHFQEEMTQEFTFKSWEKYMNEAVYETWSDAIGEFRLYTKNWNSHKEKTLKTILRKGERYNLITSKFTILSIIKGFFSEPFYAVYPHIHTPVLLLLAENPHELKAAREKGVMELQKNIEDVTVISIKGTGHMLHWDEPGQVACLIREWIKINPHK